MMAGKLGVRHQHDSMHYDPQAPPGTQWQRVCWCMCEKCFQTFGMTTPRRQRGQTIAQSSRPFGRCICPTCPCRSAATGIPGDGELLLNRQASTPKAQAAQDERARQAGAVISKTRKRGNKERRSEAQDIVERLAREDATRRKLEEDLALSREQ